MTDITEFLTSLGLEKYLPAFAEEEIDMLCLPDLTADDLKEMGMKLGSRTKLFAAIKEMKDEAARKAEEEAAQVAAEEAAKKKSEEDDTTKKAEEEEAAKKKAAEEEEAMKKKAAEEEEAAKKKAEEEEAAKKKAEDEARPADASPPVAAVAVVPAASSSSTPIEELSGEALTARLVEAVNTIEQVKKEIDECEEATELNEAALNEGKLTEIASRIKDFGKELKALSGVKESRTEGNKDLLVKASVGVKSSVERIKVLLDEARELRETAEENERQLAAEEEKRQTSKEYENAPTMGELSRNQLRQTLSMRNARVVMKVAIYSQIKSIGVTALTTARQCIEILSRKVGEDLSKLTLFMILRETTAVAVPPDESPVALASEQREDETIHWRAWEVLRQPSIGIDKDDEPEEAAFRVFKGYVDACSQHTLEITEHQDVADIRGQLHRAFADDANLVTLLFAELNGKVLRLLHQNENPIQVAGDIALEDGPNNFRFRLLQLRGAHTRSLFGVDEAAEKARESTVLQISADIKKQRLETEQRRRKEMMDVEASVVGRPPALDLISADRFLVKSGELTKITTHSKHDRQFFLFNDMLLWSKQGKNHKKKGQFQYAGHCDLKDLNVPTDVIKPPYAFELALITTKGEATKTNSYVLVAKSRTSKKNWMAALTHFHRLRKQEEINKRTTHSERSAALQK